MALSDHSAAWEAMPYFRAVDPGPEFVILRKIGEVPVMAGCGRCGRKFFTLAKFLKNHLEAEGYLREKFSQHSCQSATDKREWDSID